MTATSLKASWKQGKLGDYFRIKHGFAFLGEHFSDYGEYVLLTPGNFRQDGGIQLKGEKEKYYRGAFPPEYLLKRDDLLIVLTDLTQNAPILGAPAFIREDDRFLHNQRLGKVVDLRRDEMDPRFLYYLLNTSNVRAQIKGTATGATVKHTAPDRIYAVKVEVPPLPTQRKIAAILSAYDDLIENNTRRIKILEEMAQALYREWFVHFRFPGHEGVRLVESELGLVPEGWEVQKLGDVADVNANTIRNGYEPSRISYIDIASVSTGKIDSIIELPFSEAPGRARRIVVKGDIIWSTVRPNRRSYSLILDPAPDTVVSTGFAVLTAKRIPYTYLYFATTTDDFAGYLTNNATGSAYPAVNASDFRNADIVIPPQNLLASFHETVAGLLAAKETLLSTNVNLSRTRELLLPRLISFQYRD